MIYPKIINRKVIFMFYNVSSGTDDTSRYGYIGVFIEYLEKILEVIMNFISKINLPSFSSTAAPEETTAAQ